MPHAPFPVMGMDPRMNPRTDPRINPRTHMEPPIEDFRGVNIQTVEPRFDTGNFDERPRRPGRGPAPRRTSTGNPKKPTYYEGYIFTKVKAEHPWQKQTWACIKRTAMPVSQAELREKSATKQSLFSREKSALEQYGNLTNFQQRQVDRLVKDRMDPDDPDFEYQLAAIKEGQRNVRGSKPQMNLIVILRRQPRSGVSLQPEMATIPVPSAPSEIIDLTGQEDSERSSTNSFGSFSPPPHHAGPYPFDRHNSEPWGGHRPQVVDERFAPMPHGPPFGEEQVHRRHSPPMFGIPVEGFHEGPGGHGGHVGHGDHGGHEVHGGHDGHEGKNKKDDKKDKKDRKDKHEKGEKFEKRDKYEKDDKHEQHDKHGKKDKEKKRPEIHHSNSHKSDKKHHEHSDHFSSDSDWSHLSSGSEDTFDTLPTSSSGGTKIYRREKKQSKEEKRKSNSHHSARDRGAEKPIYREHTRKMPEKPREPSPAPSRRSGRSSVHYVIDEDVFIQPEVTHRGGREPRREPRPRQVSYSRERPRRPQRTMSYDEELHFDLDYDEPRSPHYVKKVTRLPRAPQVDYEKERLKLEVERERREKEHLGAELDRTHAELKRASRMPSQRERYPPRIRRPSPIIEREPHYPRPRRVPEQYYDDYDYDDPHYFH